MKIITRHFGNKGSGASSGIEVTFEGNASITEDVTNLKGQVDKSFIEDLRLLADELEEQNNKINHGKISRI